MARSRIQLTYDKQTGRYELVVDMEQETLDLRRHNQRHDELAREFAGGDAEIEEVEPGGGGTRGEAAAPRSNAGRLQDR